MSITQRFWKHVDKSGNCWIWTAYRKQTGYGVFNVNGKNMGAHRFSWIIKNGEIKNKLLVCHSCDNPPCVNPQHLWLGTGSENLLDAFKKGRVNRKGSNNGRAKLNYLLVKKIRAMSKNGINQRVLASKFHVGQSAISKVVLEKTWIYS